MRILTRKELRKRIQTDLQYTPDVSQAREDLNDKIDDAIRDILVSQKWPFRQRVARIRVTPDATFSGVAAITGPSQWVQGAGRTVTISTPTGWTYADVNNLAGQIGRCPWPVRAESNEDRYLIDKAEYLIGTPAAPDLPEGTLVTLTFDERYDYPGVQPDDDLVIEFHRYQLPVDCEEVLKVQPQSLNDSRIKLDKVDSISEAEWLLLAHEEPAEPVVWLDHPNNATLPLRLGDRVQAVRPRPPMTAPTLTSTAVGGSARLVPGRTYRYFYVWVRGAQRSAPSPYAEVTIGAGHDAVDITDLEVPSDTTLGWTKEVFGHDVESGEAVRVATLDLADATTQDPGGYDAERVYYHDVFPGGEYRYLRVWPRPAEGETLELMYLSSPQPLRTEGDVPGMPEPYQQAIVYWVVHQIASRHGSKDLARTHEKLLNDIVSRMQRRYLVERATDHQRRSYFTSDDRVSRPSQGRAYRVEP